MNVASASLAYIEPCVGAWFNSYVGEHYWLKTRSTGLLLGLLHLMLDCEYASVRVTVCRDRKSQSASKSVFSL
jgi:hypothetical protein